MDEENFFSSDTHIDTDLDFSFNSITTDRTTFASSSARSSLARSSLTLSFNESRLSNSINTTSNVTTLCNKASLHHRKWDPNWSSIQAAMNLSSDGKIHLRHLKLIQHLGTGNLGRVFLCKLRDCNDAYFALKVIDRDTLSKKKLNHVQTEAEILSILDHPFLPMLYAHIQVSHYTCLLIDYCLNGDLHSMLRKQPANRLPIQAVKFFAAEVVVALEYLHSLGIVYRDLKPENILLREDGHIMLSDFDLCFKTEVVPIFSSWRSQTGRSRRSFPRSCFRRCADDVIAEFVSEPTRAFSNSCVGTHEYLAPEILSGNGHGNEVDWWALGVLIYELLFGMTPFKGGSKESTLRNIASSQEVAFSAAETSEDGVTEAKDLIQKLLVKDPQKRLGSVKGATDIKRHRFFDGIKWPLIRNYKPPELRGLAKRRKTTPVLTSRFNAACPCRKSGWWKGISCLVDKQSRYCLLNSNNNSNGNYFCYKNRK